MIEEDLNRDDPKSIECIKPLEQHGGEDIALEILTWLPAKSVMRFKCISKACNTLIGQPNFIKLHKAHSQARPSATCLLFALESYVSEYWWTYPRKVQRPLEGFSLQLTRPHHSFYFEDIFICSNHCNGLVCLYSYKDTQTYMYNVTTREMKAFPLSVNHVNVKYMCQDPQLYLGFDMVKGKYKLLHIFEETNTRGRGQRIRILTLGTNSWRKIRKPTKCFLGTARHTIFLDGVVYSIQGFLITYFNFIEEKFGRIPCTEHGYGLKLNTMQTAVWGKLVVNGYDRATREYCNVLYDDLSGVFTKLVNNSNYSNSEKVALLETEGIDETMHLNTVLATASIIGAPTSLQTPYPFQLKSVSSFVENIIPLTSLFEEVV